MKEGIVTTLDKSNVYHNTNLDRRCQLRTFHDKPYVFQFVSA